ncbi:zinc carboxypeptidase A 1-like [Galleria mellonella]|uniref:Zinc carboxypeptidase A 1-like n=1 Tax=Galleria mellonella TaxID=7137 RepID=A0A6J1WDQ4_GALME|nr:zinc carboxypeptidase A 1-like [Galleria mellonella]
MLLQIKVYIITILYFFGSLFMVLFPPRNFEQSSGASIRIMRRFGDEINYKEYIDNEALLTIIQRITRNDSEVARLVYLKPITAENRSIVSLELHSDLQSKKPGILVIGALNGMVWGASNAVIELAEKLLYDSNYQTPFFNDYDWYLIPMGNPDGIHFTQKLRSRPSFGADEWSRNITVRNQTRPTVWHKNVDKNNGPGTCFGTNINRNFAYHWQDDVSKTPDQCSQYYPGVKPFSSVEAQAIRNYIHRLGDVIHLAIHLHASFVPKKEFILYPWRYSLRHPSNYRTLQDIGEYAARQSRLPDGRLYEVHQSSSDERVAGSLSDYITGVAGIDLVFLVKPYHQMYPNYTDHTILEVYVKKAMSAILSLVRGWRSSTKQNTLSFFGKDVEF